MRNSELTINLDALYQRFKRSKKSYYWVLPLTPVVFKVFMGMSWEFTVFATLVIMAIGFMVVKQTQYLSKAVGMQDNITVVNQNIHDFIYWKNLQLYVGGILYLILMIWLIFDYPIKLDNLLKQSSLIICLVGGGVSMGVTRFQIHKETKVILAQINRSMRSV